MQPPPVWVVDVGRRASGIRSMFKSWLLAGWWCRVYPLLFKMPHSAEQSLAEGVSVRNNMSGLCVDISEMMSVLDGL